LTRAAVQFTTEYINKHVIPFYPYIMEHMESALVLFYYYEEDKDYDNDYGLENIIDI